MTLLTIASVVFPAVAILGLSIATASVGYAIYWLAKVALRLACVVFKSAPRSPFDKQ